MDGGAVAHETVRVSLILAVPHSGFFELDTSGCFVLNYFCQPCPIRSASPPPPPPRRFLPLCEPTQRRAISDPD